jgi:hypothetical protein
VCYIKHTSDASAGSSVVNPLETITALDRPHHSSNFKGTFVSQPRPQASAQTSIMKVLAAQLIVLMLSAARAEVPCFDIPGCSPYYAWLAANLLAVRAVTFPCMPR